MRLDESFLYELRMRNDIESVVSGYVNLKRRGNTMVGLCPFHNEKTPSFTVYTNNGSFYCFGCGAGGDVITFVRQIENLDYMEAVRFLADRSGMTMPTDGYDDSLRQFRMRVLEANRCAARFFHAQLGTAAGAGAAEYLRGRQLTDATVRHFGIGFAPNEWTALYDHLHKNGFEDDVILQANLCSRSSRSNRLFDRFRNRVMFPFIDLRGNVVGFGGRIMPGSDDAAKYINSTDTPVYRKSQFLYGFNFAKNSKRDGIILVEGNVDVVTLHQAGFDNAVAACGTSL
ncbi:MAG: DNA primase, partial [Firmicutes bacterium]|nr:DNA primase [Bacillota bacterium]